MFQVFTSWRMVVVLLLGFSSGLPLALTGSGGAFQAWMTSEKVDLSIIGLFSLVGLPYSLKFLWSPFLDRYVPPFLGRRRGWMLVFQIALICTLALMAFSSPAAQPSWVAVLALAVAFFSASQDIVIDAYKVEFLTAKELAAGAGVGILGYRIAMIVSGAVALMMADHMSWRMVYLIMAATLLIGVVTTLVAEEPDLKEKAPRSLREAVVEPFFEFFKRRGSGEMLAFVVLYKMDVVMTLAMTTPFMLHLGFSKTDIGAVSKGFGLIATIVGSLAGGAVVAKLDLRRSLWSLGILQAAATLSFFALAHVGKNYPVMVAAITIENFSSGMANAAFAAFMMTICNKKFSATQYALLSSLMSVTRVFVAAPTGYLAKTFGWETFFIFCLLGAIPGLFLLTRYRRWAV